MKVLTVLGTRPEGVKLAPVLRELAKCGTDSVQSLLCVTGQHKEMLEQVLRVFHLHPDYDLAVETAEQSLTQVAASIMSGLDPILRSERPDWVLVQGDTTSVAAAALAAFYAGCKVGHVEAGLRSFDRHQPYPEEINRKVASAVADLHFAPTAQARKNLLHEAVPDANILVTGNTVIDALQWAASLPEPPEVAKLLKALGRGDDLARSTRAPRLIVVTAHRRENLGAPLRDICLAIRDLQQRYGDAIRVIFPVHLNPSVQQTVHHILGSVAGVQLTPPLDYLPLVNLLKRATLVLTDSGGIQEEAPAFGVPVLVLRDTTERPEGVAAGIARLIGTRRERIIAEATRLLDDPAAFATMAHAVNPYGDGHASERIVAALLESS